MTYRAEAEDGRWVTVVERGEVAARAGDGRPTRLLGTVARADSRSR